MSAAYSNLTKKIVLGATISDLSRSDKVCLLQDLLIDMMPDSHQKDEYAEKADELMVILESEE